ncbi:MAG: hypothetical protein ACYDBJ_16910, partial [Aggregatilineales bacterium]
RLAHNPVTSHYVSGVVRFPLDWRLYRRYEEVTELTDSRLPLKSIGQACRQQAQALLEALLVFASNQLQHGFTPTAILNALFAKRQLVPT